MSVQDYLIGAQRRLEEFGGFAPLPAEALPAPLQPVHCAVLQRVDAEQVTVVAIAALVSEEQVAALMDGLVSLAAAQAREERVEATALLLLAAANSPGESEKRRLVDHGLHVGAVRALVWLADVSQGHLVVEREPASQADQDLALLVSPGPLPAPVPGDPDWVDEPAAQPRSLRRLRPSAWMTLLLLTVIAGVWMAMTITGGSAQATKDSEMLIAWGAVVRPVIWTDGEYWRFLTAAFLHIGIEHLLMNGISLWSVGQAVEAFFGSGRMLYIFLVAAVSGSVLSAMLGPAIMIGAGASGAIFGLLGAVIWYRISSPLGHRIAWRPLLTILGINLLFGLALARYIDNWNHIGGLLGGFAAAAAAGVPAVDGLARPRFRLDRGPRWAAVALGAVLATGVVAGLVPVPGPGRNLAMAMEDLRQERFAEAEAGFQRAARRQPDEPEIHRFLVLTYYNWGKCREAQGELNYLISLAPHYSNLAQIREAVGRCLPGGRD